MLTNKIKQSVKIPPNRDHTYVATGSRMTPTATPIHSWLPVNTRSCQRVPPAISTRCRVQLLPVAPNAAAESTASGRMLLRVSGPPWTATTFGPEDVVVHSSKGT